MIANLIGGFIAMLLGVSLIGPVATQVTSVASSTNATGTTCSLYDINGSLGTPSDTCQLYLSTSWGASVLKLVPGFFALTILGIGIAVTYTSLRQAGIV